MHPISRAIVVGCASILLVLSSRSAYSRGANPKATPNHQDTERSNVGPKRGMSKAQVPNLYGDRDSSCVNSRGEASPYFFTGVQYWIPITSETTDRHLRLQRGRRPDRV